MKKSKRPVPYGQYPSEEIRLKNGKRAIIRLFKKTDLEGIWQNFNDVVEEGIYLPVYTPVKTEWERISWYHDIRDEGNICIVAENPLIRTPKNIIGQLTIEHIPWEAAAHVGQLGIIVQDHYRNQGIGYKLIQYAAKLARLIGKQKLILSTFTSNNMAIHLYKKCGFHSVGIYHNQYFINERFQDELMMEWFLD
ncbi:N-acetyltransferase family protein [Candidatus Harpocratesius sp.]